MTFAVGESISELVNSVEQSGSKYTALYVSDPYWYTSYKTLQRFLAETAKGNSTPEVTTGCDELCKFKSSLLEGILVVRSYSFTLCYASDLGFHRSQARFMKIIELTSLIKHLGHI